MTEEYYVENDRVVEFVETVHDVADDHDEIPALLSALRDPFDELLADDGWLPEQFQRLPDEDYDNKSDMGGDIAQWLLYREDGKLSISSLVVPPGVETPVHDHLAWGLVGLYQGRQRETFFRRVDGEAGEYEGEQAQLEEVSTHEADPGYVYELVPPEGDIHSVSTISDVPSVSIHLLGADIGCIPRHAFDPDADLVRQFQSGYTNVACDDELAAADGGDTHGHHGHHGHGLGGDDGHSR